MAKYAVTDATGRIVQTWEGVLPSDQAGKDDFVTRLQVGGRTAHVVADANPMPDPTTQYWDGSAFVTGDPPA